MRQVVAFEVTPGSFDVVQLRSIARQPFDGDPRARSQSSGAGFAGVDRPVVEHEDHWLSPAFRLRTEAPVELFEQADAVSTALARRGMDNKFAGASVECAHDRHLARLAGRCDPQIGSPLSPNTSQAWSAFRAAKAPGVSASASSA